MLLHSFLGHIRLHIDHFCYNPLRTIFSIVNNYKLNVVLRFVMVPMIATILITDFTTTTILNHDREHKYQYQCR